MAPNDQAGVDDSKPSGGIRLSDILKSADGENDRELTAEEAEAVRALGERLRGTMSRYVNPPWIKSFSNYGRLNQFATANKYLPMPEIIRANALATSLTRIPMTKFLVTPRKRPWMKNPKVVGSDLYRSLGMGQSNLSLLGAHLVRNTDFGLRGDVGKCASLWAVQQSSVFARLTTLAKRLKVGFYPPNLAWLRTCPGPTLPTV